MALVEAFAIPAVIAAMAVGVIALALFNVPCSNRLYAGPGPQGPRGETLGPQGPSPGNAG